MEIGHDDDGNTYEINRDGDEIKVNKVNKGGRSREFIVSIILMCCVCLAVGITGGIFAIKGMNRFNNGVAKVMKVMDEKLDSKSDSSDNVNDNILVANRTYEVKELKEEDGLLKLDLIDLLEDDSTKSLKHYETSNRYYLDNVKVGDVITYMGEDIFQVTEVIKD